MKERIDYLISRWIDRNASDEERTELLQLLSTPGYTEEFKQSLDQVWFNMQVDRQMEDEAARAIFNNITGGKLVKMPANKERFKIYRIAAAAAIILIILSGIIMNRFSGTGNEELTTTAQTSGDIEVVPGKYKARLTLADGSTIILDSATVGELARQGGTVILNKEGNLVYSHLPGITSGEPVYNKLSTARGETYATVLADGSKVWLNAASSIRFPVIFSGDERRVEITGEAYFEVAHDAGKSFHVTVNGMEVQVLGTHFNINSYTNESSVRTTLLEGRVAVKSSDNQVYLNPGQQAVLTHGQGTISVAYDVNVEEVVAWKNGQFLFNSADIESIMRQVERWYDVDVIYEKKTAETFSGDLPRSESIIQLIKILEATGKLDIRINGKRIMVKSK